MKKTVLIFLVFFILTNSVNAVPELKNEKIIDAFIQKNGKPLVYIGGGRKDSYDYCKENNIPRIFANLEAGPEIEGVESANSFHELEKAIKKFI